MTREKHTPGLPPVRRAGGVLRFGGHSRMVIPSTMYRKVGAEEVWFSV